MANVDVALQDLTDFLARIKKKKTPGKPQDEDKFAESFSDGIISGIELSIDLVARHKYTALITRLSRTNLNKIN